MKKILFISFSAILALTACHKEDTTLTKVGFYVIDPNYTQTQTDGYIYSLYIDNQFEGGLQISNTATMDSTIMKFKILDSKKHIIEVKMQNSLVSSTYLQIEEEKVGTGSSGMVQLNKPNGAKYQKPNNYGYSSYGIYQ